MRAWRRGTGRATASTPGTRGGWWAALVEEHDAAIAECTRLWREQGVTTAFIASHSDGVSWGCEACGLSAKSEDGNSTLAQRCLTPPPAVCATVHPDAPSHATQSYPGWAQVDDSIEGIYGTLKRCALISKAAGGVGLSASNIRASGSYIRGTNGTSNGLIPMLRVFNV